jgi:hypothetical protein
MKSEIDVLTISCGDCPWFQPAEGNILPFTPDCQSGICTNPDIFLLEVQSSTKPFLQLKARFEQEDLMDKELLEITVKMACHSPKPVRFLTNQTL